MLWVPHNQSSKNKNFGKSAIRSEAEKIRIAEGCAAVQQGLKYILCDKVLNQRPSFGSQEVWRKVLTLLISQKMEP
jgi:hypothetical protein